MGWGTVEPVGQVKKTMLNCHMIRHLLLYSLLLGHAHMMPGSDSRNNKMRTPQKVHQRRGFYSLGMKNRNDDHIIRVEANMLSLPQSSPQGDLFVLT